MSITYRHLLLLSLLPRLVTCASPKEGLVAFEPFLGSRSTSFFVQQLHIPSLVSITHASHLEVTWQVAIRLFLPNMDLAQPRNHLKVTGPSFRQAHVRLWTCAQKYLLLLHLYLIIITIVINPFQFSSTVTCNEITVNLFIKGDKIRLACKYQGHAKKLVLESQLFLHWLFSVNYYSSSENSILYRSCLTALFLMCARLSLSASPLDGKPL